MKTIKKGFASDNWSGVCPEIMDALNEVNKGHIFAYGEGEEEVSKTAFRKFEEHFGKDIKVFFVYNGTAANVLGVGHLINSYQAIVAAHTAHLNEDECGAPEKFIGTKILEIHTDNGKIVPDQVKPFMGSIGFQHHSQPKVISISQVTEMGTVYTPEEIKALADFAHKNNMYLHMDGARISNAVAALNTDFRNITTDVGVDVLSFGGTKNGLMFGEVVVFFNKELALDFEYARKQGMQLHSKMRFIASQFTRYLTNGLWRKNAETANNMAKKLAEKISTISELSISNKAEANGVFVLMPPELIPKLQEHYFFHVWNESPVFEGIIPMKEVRLMCSWDTTEEDIVGFVDLIKNLVD
ncbi:MAG: threonine aldolase [Bacteroidetes bacterium]|nr:threonine aldolase [Bacteroidota bacterium]